MSTKPYPRPTSESSTATGSDHNRHYRHYKQPRTSPPSPPPSPPTHPRPMSPSSLRELDSPDMPLRKYPAPPTGHDLMAMFPPAPPNKFEMLPGISSTSDFFKCQERAFFAHIGKEIVRVRVEGDFPHQGNPDFTAVPYPSHSPGQLPSQPTNFNDVAPLPYPCPAPVDFSPMFPPLTSHTPTSNQFPSNLHPPVLPGHQTKSVHLTPPELPEDTTKPAEKHEPDESWRRPMPYAERRRAGKHTRRVIVRTY